MPIPFSYPLRIYYYSFRFQLSIVAVNFDIRIASGSKRLESILYVLRPALLVEVENLAQGWHLKVSEKWNLFCHAKSKVLTEVTLEARWGS